MNAIVTVNAPVAAPAPVALSLKVGAIKYKSIRHAANVLAARTGEEEGVVYSRVYQRVRAGYTLAEALSSKPFKTGKKGQDIEYKGKTYPSLLDAVKAYTRALNPFKKVDPAEVSKLYARANTRMKSGMNFLEALAETDLRGQANGKETIVNGVTYPSLMDAVRANVPDLTDENENSVYIRFASGLKKGKTFESILATPMRSYTRRVLTSKEVLAEKYEAETEMFEMLREQAEENAQNAA
jgi:hypothetical protein